MKNMFLSYMFVSDLINSVYSAEGGDVVQLVTQFSKSSLNTSRRISLVKRIWLGWTRFHYIKSVMHMRRGSWVMISLFHLMTSSNHHASYVWTF
jgi:hypothetical protein